MHDLGPLKGVRVLCRIDANVPMDGTRILDDTRLRLVVPTIRALCREGAAVVLLAHLGKGGPKETLAPVAKRLGTLLGRSVPLRTERIGTAALADRLRAMEGGDAVLLENLRRYRGERANDAAFAQRLATLGSCYVNDAFSASHRPHASLVGLPKLLPAAAGELMMGEVAALDHLRTRNASPFVALLGGAKITTKAPVILRLLRIADSVLMGGALAHQFFAARGYEVGSSLLEEEGIAIAKRIERDRKIRNLTLPLDVVVGDPRARTPAPRVVVIAPKPHRICAGKEAILDIGPLTIRAYAAQLKTARTLLWNGPMGTFERAPYHHGSVALARVIASRSSGRAFGVVGGGETLAVLARTGMAKYIDYVSSGGGALLAYIANDGKLPGIEALRTRKRLRRIAT